VVEETPLDRLPTMIQQARRAQEEWSGWPLDRRAEVLKAVRYRLRDEAEAIAWTICHETGKPHLEAMNADI
jgi:acyl-CoA reductase-like NAD-dependent aldehyde dehydrogenase